LELAEIEREGAEKVLRAITECFYEKTNEIKIE
jgi:hypothetical protein